MKKFAKFYLTLALTVLAVFGVFFVGASAAQAEDKWVGAWGAGATEIGIEGYDSITAYVGKVTMRAVITPTTSGSKVRFKISNLYGDENLVITRATIAKSIKDSKIDTSSVKIVTFNEGYQGVTLAPGAEIYTDPVVFDVRAGEKIAISIFADEFTEIKTMALSGADTYITLGEDATSKDTFGLLPNFIDSPDLVKVISALLGSDLDLNLGYKFIKVVPMVVNMDVMTEDLGAYSVVVIGDSTVANEFPLYLSERINEAGVSNVGVVGKGIIGNKLLGDGLGFGSKIYGKAMLSRLDVDALKTAGVKYVIVKIGCNDIVHPVCTDMLSQQPTAEDIIEGYKQVFERCHEAGIKVVVIGITQWKGNTRNYFGTGDKYIRTDEEFNADWQIALDVNEWLSKTDLHDGYVSFNELSASPKDPDALYPEYTTDGVHPSDTLQRLWADSFPLSLIGVGKSVNKVTLNDNAMGMYKGYGKQLTATISPADAEDKTLIWTSSNPEVASVTQNGYVKALKNGITYITCRTVDGLFSDTCYVRVVTKVESVSVDKTTAKIYNTKSVTLKATVLPADSSNKNVTWSTSNKKVATVDKNGVVTGVGSGTCDITVTTENRGLTAKCRVTVVKKNEVTGITISRTAKGMYKDGKYKLTASVVPENATFTDIIWSSSNPDIASVDSNGKVTAHKAGTAYITAASYDNPMIKKTCRVVVVVKTKGVSLNKTSATVYTDNKLTLKATVAPSDATNKNVTWKSSDKKIATVSSKGVVTGVKAGTVTITCTTESGSYVAKCTVKVVKSVKTTSVKFTKSSVSIDDGTAYQLGITVAPSNATNQKVTYTSSNANVAKVYSNGKIYGVTPGTATITVKTEDTGKTATCKVTVKGVKPTSVKLDAKSMTVEPGQVKKLTATVSPSNCSYKTVTWKSSDPKAVYVNQKGYIKGMKAGASATITCTTNTGAKVATCKVKVKSIAVTDVTLNKSSVSIYVGESYRLTANIVPSNATNQKVIWESANPKIARVSDTGLIVPVAAGSTMITCTTEDGEFVAYCIVQVKSVKVLGVSLNKSSLIANKGASFTLIATVVPSNATNPAVTWKSTNPNVATVNNGVVKAVGVGICEIKVYTEDGNYIATCKVQVI